MARTLVLLVAVVLLTSAVLADYLYTYKQADTINERVVQCVRNVKTKSDGTNPGDDCRFEGNIQLAKGATKESLAALIQECIVGKGGSKAEANSARSCLDKSLAKPL